MKKNNRIWINPLGGLGDTLMLSGVLKTGYDSDPDKRYNMVRRTKYPGILDGHPAIEEIGFPPDGAGIIGTDYWSRDEYASGDFHAMDILARIFELPEQRDRKLYIPPFSSDDPVLTEFVPWKKINVLIAPASDSPRKEMHLIHWEQITKRLSSDGCLVVQAGKRGQRSVRGAYSLIGLTTPRELIALMTRFDAVITSDNFIMHAAHLTGVPSVVLWGPTDEHMYGYPGQHHIRAYPVCGEIEKCIGPGLNAYGLPCQFGPEGHCMNRINKEQIYYSFMQLIKEKEIRPGRS